MTEPWLRSNSRAVLALLILPLLLVAVGAVLAALPAWRAAPWPIPTAGVLLLAIGLAAAFSLWRWSRIPRLAYADGQLLVYLQGTTPERVPIEQVEVFFRGQGDARLANRPDPDVKTNTIVVRLAEADESWHNRTVNPSLGQWEGGYIIIRGTWCEPITVDLLRKLNAQLVAVHRALRPCGESCTGEGCGA